MWSTWGFGPTQSRIGIPDVTRKVLGVYFPSSPRLPIAFSPTTKLLSNRFEAMNSINQILFRYTLYILYYIIYILYSYIYIYIYSDTFWILIQHSSTRFLGFKKTDPRFPEVCRSRNSSFCFNQMHVHINMWFKKLLLMIVHELKMSLNKSLIAKICKICCKFWWCSIYIHTNMT